MTIFSSFFLCNIGQENVFYDILERYNAFLGYENKKFKNSKYWHFSIYPLFWSNNGLFSNFFFLGKIRLENVFYDILEQKSAFLGYKNKKFKSRSIDIFGKGLTHGLGPKMASFPSFFLRQCRQEKCLLRYSRAKKRLSRLWKQEVQESKYWHFSKGVNPCFRSKNGDFSNFFFFGNIGQQNVLYDILERKNVFLGYKNKKFKKSNNWYFCKGVNPWSWSKNG